MAITFTSTRAGSSPDYMRYVFNDESGLVRTDRYLDSTLLDFALVPADTGYVHLDRGAYITIDSTTYPKFFTGYITNEAEATYVGKDKNGNPVFGYKYQATADEYILSMKPLGILPPYLNMSMGQILKNIVNAILPGVFDVTNIQDGPIVAQYIVTPDKLFKNVYQDLCVQASYVFYGNDHKLYFKPQDDATLGSISIDGHGTHFTPSRLQIRASSSPIINDATVLGQLEPQTYMHEYFIGTGLQSAFPLTAGVFGADNCLLLEDTFSGSSIDNTIWTVYAGGSVVQNTAQNTFQLFNSYLNVVGGSANNSFDTWLQSYSAMPMEGRMRFTHGEFDFMDVGSGFNNLLGCCWSQEPNAALTGCLYGLKTTGATLNPIVSGVVDTSQFVTVSTQMRYIIRTVVEFTKHARVTNKYTYLDSTGTLQSVSSQPLPDNATWQTLISEVDPTNGTLVNQWTMKNTSTMNGVSDMYAIYTPVVVDNANLTLSNVSISIPVCCTLETATDVALVNGSFDDWDDSQSPSGWVNPTNVIEDSVWSNTSNALRLVSPSASVEQDVSQLLQPGVTYYIMWRGMRHVVGNGTLSLKVYGTGLAATGIDIDLSVMQLYYTSFTYKLLDPLTSIPADCKFKISYTESSGLYNPVWVDSLTILSEFQHQLVGPNEMDAMDGLAPVATIVAGNANAQTKSTFSGAPQYNPGQDQLVFFKNSVTLTSNVPPENQIVRLSYRAAGSAVGRVVDSTSVNTEKSLYSDDGVRSVVRTDLQPRPRTSLECELAAKAIVGENSFQHYEGSYTQFSPYFSQAPRAGMPIVFSNLPGVPYLTAEEVTEVQTTILSEKPVELFSHEISFGKPDHLRRFLSKVQTPIDSYQQNPVSPYADPQYVDVTKVSLNYIEDVTKPVLQNWDGKYIYMDTGQDLSADATAFEIRYTDDGWGQGNGKNLMLSTTSRLFQVPRNPRGRVFFIRQVNTTTNAASRYSACVNVAFPVVASNAYIRDWECHTIDTADPLVTGTDLAKNRYKVNVEYNTQVYLNEWQVTMKTAPTSATAQFDILLSEDKGQTWASLFPQTPKPNCPVNTITNEGTQFQTRFLQRGDLLRYDCLAADGVAAGLELVLMGRVMSIGSSPIGIYYGQGTGSTGAPTGTVTQAGTVTTGIGAEYLMNEGGGVILHDDSGLHRDSSLGTNQPSWDPSFPALDFTNTNQYVNVPDATLSIDSNTIRDFTAEAWIYPNIANDVISFDSAALKLSYDTHWNVTLNGSTGQPTPINLSSTSTVTAGAWQQVVVTRVNSTVTIYVNGVQAGSVLGNDYPLALGTVADGKFLGTDPAVATSTTGSPVMKLGIVRFYSVGLSATQVTQNYNATKATYGL